jgi:hypothetical protein
VACEQGCVVFGLCFRRPPGPWYQQYFANACGDAEYERDSKPTTSTKSVTSPNCPLIAISSVYPHCVARPAPSGRIGIGIVITNYLSPFFHADPFEACELLRRSVRYRGLHATWTCRCTCFPRKKSTAGTSCAIITKEC